MNKRSRGAAMLLAAGGSLPEPPPVSSPTPSVAPGSPNTSPASKKRSADSQATGAPPMGSPKKQPTPKGLPEHLQRLQAVFELMHSGRGLLKRRAEKITATTLAPIVESVTKRNFKVEYIQQIKFLYPQAFDWQYVRVPSEHEKNKLDFHLLLQFERCTAPGGASCPSDANVRTSSSVGRINEAAERAELLARATAWFEAQQAQGAPPDTLVPCAPLPPKDPTSIIIGGSPMQVHRRMSTSPAHLRNSLQGMLHATGQQQQQRQQAAGSSPTLHRGSSLHAPHHTTGQQQQQQQQQQRQQAAGSSPTLHRGSSLGPGASCMRTGVSPPQFRQREDVSRARDGTEASTAGSTLPSAGGGAPSPAQQGAGGPDGCAVIAASQDGRSGTPPNHLPHLERRAGRPGGAIPLPTTPTSSRAKQRPQGHSLPATPGAAGGGGITESGKGALAGGGGGGTPGAGDGASPTPRVARRRLQLGAESSRPAAGGEEGGMKGSGGEQGQQQQQQQLEGPAPLGACGSVRCPGAEGSAYQGDGHAEAQVHLDGGTARAPLALEEHTVDMSAFDDEPMTVQVPVQSVNASPATPASSQHHTHPQEGTPASGGSRRNSLLSRFMSPKSLETLQRNAQKAQQSPALKAEADLLQSQRMLPQAMDLVRAAFGLKGPVVKQREELVELMRQKSSLSIALSTSEAARALQQLLQHAPEMITQEQQGDVWVIRLRRTADVNAIRMRLCSIACQAARSSTASSPTR